MAIRYKTNDDAPIMLFISISKYKLTVECQSVQEAISDKLQN